jgi:hypothetical protein
MSEAEARRIFGCYLAADRELRFADPALRS